MTRPNQGLFSLAPGGGKMRDPGNEVAISPVSPDDQPMAKQPEDSGYEIVKLSEKHHYCHYDHVKLLSCRVDLLF